MKQHRNRPAARHPEARATPGRAARRAAIAGAIAALAAVVVLAIWLVPVQRGFDAARPLPSADPNWTIGMLRADGLRIVVSGRSDASAVLDPERFSKREVRHGYWIATQIPALLNQLYCWCGCENRGLHRSNLACFEDEMARDCPVCLGTAEIAYEMHRQGIDDAARIQAAVDVLWRPR
jgi:hypothetical protein